MTSVYKGGSVGFSWYPPANEPEPVKTKLTLAIEQWDAVVYSEIDQLIRMIDDSVCRIGSAFTYTNEGTEDDPDRTH